MISNQLKQIEVVAAIIQRPSASSGTEIFCTQREYGEWKVFLCSLTSGELTLLEHEDSRWLSKEELDNVKWLPADKEIIELLKQR